MSTTAIASTAASLTPRGGLNSGYPDIRTSACRSEEPRSSCRRSSERARGGWRASRAAVQAQALLDDRGAGVHGDRAYLRWHPRQGHPATRGSRSSGARLALLGRAPHVPDDLRAVRSWRTSRSITSVPARSNAIAGAAAGVTGSGVSKPGRGQVAGARDARGGRVCEQRLVVVDISEPPCGVWVERPLNAATQAPHVPFERQASDRCRTDQRGARRAWSNAVHVSHLPKSRCR
jgi:hypothetical protein